MTLFPMPKHHPRDGRQHAGGEIWGQQATQFEHYVEVYS